MAKYQRETTQYPGVFWLTIQGIRTLYIRYKRPGTYKTIEEKLGSEKNWTASQGNGAVQAGGLAVPRDGLPREPLATWRRCKHAFVAA